MTCAAVPIVYEPRRLGLLEPEVGLEFDPSTVMGKDIEDVE